MIRCSMKRDKELKQRMIIVLILCWLGWHLAFPVDLIQSDLGRHIKNGELLLQGNRDILYKNYYSYTNPEYPFFNYHWLFGVFCFVCWHYFGFTGLSLIYLTIELLAFYVFFRCWQRYASFASACAFGLLSFPLISFRYEIRPEGISYLFCGLFWWLIDSFQQKRLKSWYLIIALSLLQIIWVNTHIFFMMGPILTALFWWQAHSHKEEEQANVLRKSFLSLLLMCLINPFGVNIFAVAWATWKTAAAFPIIESLPVFLVLKAKVMAYKPVLIYFLVILAFLIATLCFLIRREGFKKYVLIGSITLILALASMKVMRMIGLFGYFFIPLSMYVYSRLVQTQTAKFKKNIEIFLVVIGIMVSILINFDGQQKHGLGLVPGSNDAAEFFKREKISGNIFNNYGIGGYLIFHLSPQQKLFVDNRGVAAFPEDFIKTTYVQMQRDDSVWHQLDQKYNFNAIFCFPEYSSWGIRFLANRLADHDWALVFLDRGARIFVKRNAQNAAIIRRNEIHILVRDGMLYYSRSFAEANRNIK